MKHISETPAIENLQIENPDKVFEITNQCLPENCFWREGEKIHIEMLNFVAELLRNDCIIAREIICFYCSVQHSSHYEDCSDKTASWHFH